MFVPDVGQLWHENKKWQRNFTEFKILGTTNAEADKEVILFVKFDSSTTPKNDGVEVVMLPMPWIVADWQSTEKIVFFYDVRNKFTD